MRDQAKYNSKLLHRHIKLAISLGKAKSISAQLKKKMLVTFIFLNILQAVVNLQTYLVFPNFQLIFQSDFSKITSFIPKYLLHFKNNPVSKQFNICNEKKLQFIHHYLNNFKNIYTNCCFGNRKNPVTLDFPLLRLVAIII